MKIHFFLRNGVVMTWTVPEAERENFVFAPLCRGWRCDGFFQSSDMHIVYAEIATIMFDREGTLVSGPGTIKPPSPTGMTMQ